MRKSVILGVGIVSAALAVAGGIAYAGAAPSNGSPSRPIASADVTISQADAEALALQAVPSGTVLETSPDLENGRPVWNVHLSTPDGTVEVKVDALTGAVRIDDDRNADRNDDGVDDRGHDVGDDHGGDRHGGDDHSGPGRDGSDDHGGSGRH